MNQCLRSLLTAAISLLLVSALKAQMLTGTGLDVSNGLANNNNSMRTAVVGSGNITDLGGNNGVFGSGNSLFSVGQSLVVGTYNTVERDEDGARENVVIGKWNYAKDSENALVGGVNNHVHSRTYWSLTYGYGLINVGEESQAVLGEYNAPLSGALLSVGNGLGSGSASRANAFIIYRNGDVIIPKRQGDISMGIFSQP